MTRLALFLALTGCAQQAVIQSHVLRFADVRDVVPEIEALAGPGSGVVAIVADRRTNTLFVDATEAGQQRVADLLRALDVSVDDGETDRVVVYFLAHRQAESLVDVLRGALNDDLRIEADPVTNAVIGVGDRGATDRLGQLIDRLDVAEDSENPA